MPSIEVLSRKTINPANAYLVRQRLTKWTAASNTFVPWTGVTTASVSFATDELGASPITGMTNIAMSAASVAGIYYAEITAAVINLLIPYNGQTVYQIVTAGVNGEYKAVTPLYVSQPRWAQ